MSEEYQPPKSNIGQPEEIGKRRLLLGLLVGIVLDIISRHIADLFAGFSFNWYSHHFDPGDLHDFGDLLKAEYFFIFAEFIVLGVLVDVIIGYCFARVVNHCTKRDLLIFLVTLIVTNELYGCIMFNETGRDWIFALEYVTTIPCILLGGFLWMRQYQTREYQSPNTNQDRPNQTVTKVLIFGLLVGIGIYEIGGIIALTSIYSFIIERYSITGITGYLLLYFAIGIVASISAYLFARILYQCTYKDILIFLIVFTFAHIIIWYLLYLRKPYSLNSVFIPYLITLPCMYLGANMWIRQSRRKE